MKIVMRTTLALAALALAATVMSAPAQAAEGGVKVGFLTCHVSSGFGFIFGSSKDVDCAYAPLGGSASEKYKGSITKFGVDIGYSAAAVIVWGVIAPTGNVAPGALAGQYAGVTASATVGVGVGAHVLVGGFNNSFSLQPLSLEGNTGLNVAGGIGALNLQAAP
jgi:hypothetical protein